MVLLLMVGGTGVKQHFGERSVESVHTKFLRTGLGKMS